MRCAEIQPLFSHALDDDLTVAQASDLYNHISICSACTDGLLQMRDALAALRGLSEAGLSDLPDRVLRAVRILEAPPRPFRALRARWLVKTVAATAAALVVGLGGAWLGRWSDGAPAPAVAPTPATAEARLAAAERVHRQHGDIWLDGRWSTRVEAVTSLMNERGTVARHGMWIAPEAWDEIEAGKLLVGGNWLTPTTYLEQVLVRDGFTRSGRSWLASEDRSGMLVDGARVDPDTWMSEQLIASGHLRGADGHWRPVGDPPLAERSAAPTAPAAPVASTDESARQDEQILAAQGQWRALGHMPGSSEADVPRGRPAFAYGHDMTATVSATAGGPQPVALPEPGTGLSGWKIVIASGATLGTPALIKGTVHIGGGLASAAVHAFDARSGSPRWTTSFGDNGPSSPAVIGDDVVYTTESCSIYQLENQSGKSALACFIAGSLSTMPAVSERALLFTAPSGNGGAMLAVQDWAHPQRRWTAGLPADLRTAPIVHDGLVIGATVSGSLLAWRLSTGDLAWRMAVGALAAPRVAGDRLLVRRAVQGAADSATLGEVLSLVDPATGYATTRFLGTPQPLCRSAGAPSGQPLGLGPAVAAHGLAFSVRESRLEAVDLVYGRMIWSHDLGAVGVGMTHSDLCLTSDLVVVGTLDGRLLGIDMATGAERWSAKVGSAIGNRTTIAQTMFRVQPVVAQGRVYVTTLAGELVCIDTGDRTLEGSHWWGG